MSNGFNTLWNLDSDDSTLGINYWFHSIHPLDKILIPPQETNFDIQYRILQANGEIRWVRNRGIKLIDQKIAIGHIRDINSEALLEEQNLSLKLQVEKKTTTIKEIIETFVSEKTEIKENLKNKICLLVLPVINQIKINKLFKPQLMLRLEKNILGLVDNSSSILALNNDNPLSQKEEEVANLIKIGHSTKEIANLLHISTHTVTTYRNRMRKKMGLKNHKVNLTRHLTTQNTQ
ncbi:LuxR C-terminal-related transcriptional regulator [bacterium]|nr:LuxR C-terminal-related transcriptional regulator [bacterium]